VLETPVLFSIVTRIRDFQKKPAIAYALYRNLKMIFRLWIGLRSCPMRIQLKMCPSLRGNFKESVFILKQLCHHVQAIWWLPQ